jgi:hypothetical protein
MKLFITFISAVMFSLNALGQKSLDTVKVYNVNCTYTEGNSIITWGGNFTHFFPPTPCPRDSINIYLENYQSVQKYMNSRKVFYMKLYDINNVLQYEGLKYSTKTIKSFGINQTFIKN